MSQEKMVEIIKRAVTDANFRALLAKDPHRALSAYELTQDEVETIRQSLAEDQVDPNASAVEERTSRASIPLADLFGLLGEASEGIESTFESGLVSGDDDVSIDPTPIFDEVAMDPDPILDEVKRRAAAEGISLGKAVSRFLAEALANHPDAETATPSFTWRTAAMGAQVDLADKDALTRTMAARSLSSALALMA